MQRRPAPRKRGRSRSTILATWATVPLVALATLTPTGASGHEGPDSDPELQAELAQVRAATAQYHQVEVAEAAGYELGWVNGTGTRIVAGCVAGPSGAMGYHYFNADLMADHDVDALAPEVLVYAPAPDRELRLVAVEWVVLSDLSNPPGVSEAPSVLGMDMHILVPPPGPAFWLTHAWVWAHNPSGMFADFNPEVTCTG